MIEAVLSYHMSPMTCGVSKFNHQLAERLGVPCLPLTTRRVRWPLISIKTAELPKQPSYPTFVVAEGFDLFMHDWDPGYYKVARMARRVFAGSKSIAEAIRPCRSDVITAFCPSTINGNPHRGAYRVLAFGMAHKLALDKFRALKEELDVTRDDYTVSLSTAVHEGSPWDTALTESTDAMRAIFGDKLRVLGYLGDDALAKELQDCDAVAVYFDPAVRENNTSAWAAVAAGKTLYTNTDADSPDLYDPERYSWDKLVELLA